MDRKQINNCRIVCFGDSITDAKIMQSNPEYKEDGSGYVSMFKRKVNTFFTQLNIEVHNRGINGNKTMDLIGRLERDVLSLKPDIVTMLIGINDVWHPHRENILPDFPQIEENYRELIRRITSKGIRLVLLTPFLFPYNDFCHSLFPHFETMHGIVLKLAEEYGLECIDIYKAMKEIADVVGYHHVTRDCIHPTILGHGIIAHELEKYFITLK